MRAKPSLVFIPGLLCNEIMWRAQLDYFKEMANCQVADITQHNNVAQLADYVLQQAPAKFSLVGFSLGGWVAMQIMAVAPERVTKLAIMSTTKGILLPPGRKALTAGIESLQCGHFLEYIKNSYRLYFHPSRHDDAVLKQTFLTMAQQVGCEVGIRQMHTLLAREQPFAELNKISCPTIVIGGQEDQRAIPAAMVELANSIPNAQLHFVANAAHFTSMEQPQIVNQLLYQWFIG